MNRSQFVLFCTYAIAAIVILSAPEFAFAQGRSVQNFIGSATNFINDNLIPLLFGVAILFFLVNVTRYFIISATDTYAKEQARNYAIYAIIALVFISSIWGLVNLVTQSIGIPGESPMCPDYNPECNNVDEATSDAFDSGLGDSFFSDGFE